MTAAELRDRIGAEWTAHKGGFGTRASLEDVRGFARTLRDGGARFVALLVRPSGEALELAWCFDASGVLLRVETALSPSTPAPSVVDIWPGADWAEREARDYYALEFAGRAATPPLMLRPGDTPGVLLGGKGGQP